MVHVPWLLLHTPGSTKARWEGRVNTTPGRRRMWLGGRPFHTGRENGKPPTSRSQCNARRSDQMPVTSLSPLKWDRRSRSHDGNIQTNRHRDAWELWVGSVIGVLSWAELGEPLRLQGGFHPSSMGMKLSPGEGEPGQRSPGSAPGFPRLGRAVPPARADCTAQGTVLSILEQHLLKKNMCVQGRDSQMTR